MRVAVVGAGGQGGYFAGMLARAGIEVCVIARGETLMAIRSRGLRLTSAAGETFSVVLPVEDDPRRLGTVDLMFFCVKTYDLNTAAPQARSLVGKRTTVIPVQNGVEAWDQLGRHFGKEALLGGVSYVAAATRQPGDVVFGGVEGGLLLGEIAGAESGRVRETVETIRQAGVEVAPHPRIALALWEKFVLVCATGGVMSLLRRSMGEVLRHPEGPRLCRGVMAEVVAVARARGVALADDIVDRTLVFMKTRIDPTTRSSQLNDLLAGRRLELEALNGAVVRLGRQTGTPTPLNETIYAALLPHVEGRS